MHDVELFIGLLIDVAALTAQLYLVAASVTPFVFLYLLQIAVGAMLLRGGYIWSIVVVASACVVLLAQHSQPLPPGHQCARRLGQPLCAGPAGVLHAQRHFGGGVHHPHQP